MFPKPPRRQRGLVLVLVIFVIVLLFVAIVFGNLLTNVGRRLDLAAKNRAAFDAIDGAIAQYVIRNQRLPCPASGSANTGLADPDLPAVNCASPDGVLPWATLGLERDAVLDAWGRFISYRVDDDFARSNGLNLSDCLDSDVDGTPYALSGTGGTVCNSATHENTRSDYFASKGGLTVVDRGSSISPVAYALISHGETGYGAYYPDNAARMTAPSSANEALNVGSGGTYAIVEPSESAVPPGDASHFDDVLAYKSAVDLVVGAKAGGRPWPLYIRLSRTNAGANVFGTWSTFQVGRKIAVAGGPVMVTAFSSPATAQRYICAYNVPGGPMGADDAIAPCTIASFDGTDQLTTSNGEGLTFDFRAKRRILKLTLAEFDANPTKERVELTFFNGTTQIGPPMTKLACPVGASDTVNYNIDVGTALGEFTKVEIRALNRDGTATTSDFSVGSIAACAHDQANPQCDLPGSAGGFCP